MLHFFKLSFEIRLVWCFCSQNNTHTNIFFLYVFVYKCVFFLSAIRKAPLESSYFVGNWIYAMRFCENVYTHILVRWYAPKTYIIRVCQSHQIKLSSSSLELIKLEIELYQPGAMRKSAPECCPSEFLTDDQNQMLCVKLDWNRWENCQRKWLLQWLRWSNEHSSLRD